MLDVMRRNVDAIEGDVNSLVFHMNGGLDYEDAWVLTSDQRRKLVHMIQKHYEAQDPKKKSQL